MRILWLADCERNVPSDPSWLSDAERERAGGMRFTKRRNDYLLGRWVGKNAVARALARAADPASLASIAIRNAADGAPEVWIDGDAAPIGISLTDRAGWGVCAVGIGDAALGCDLELVEPRSRLFVADYLTADEGAWVRAADGDDEWDARANLMWCAKESALKVLRTGLRRDTRDVEVTTRYSVEKDWERLAVRVVDGRVFPGWWRRFGDFLLTFAAARDVPPPVCLADPPPLEAAGPSHAWMECPVSPAPGAGSDDP